MRLRILELPLETVGEVTKTPFVFVIDQVEIEQALADTYDMAGQAGARGVLVFAGDVDLG